MVSRAWLASLAALAWACTAESMAVLPEVTTTAVSVTIAFVDEVAAQGRMAATGAGRTLSGHGSGSSLIAAMYAWIGTSRISSSSSSSSGALGSWKKFMIFIGLRNGGARAALAQGVRCTGAAITTKRKYALRILNATSGIG